MRLSAKVGQIALAAALFAGVATTTGCSAGTEQAGGGAAPKAIVYKIGVGMPMTQGATFLGQGIDRAVRLAAAQASESERAKALGVTFEVTTGDDLGDPKTGVNVANMFAGDTSVVGVVGHLNSGVCMPASKVYSEAKLPMVAPAATSPELTLQGLNNVFRLCTIDTVQGEFAATSAVDKLGFKSTFVVDDSTTYGEGLGARFAEVFESKGGTVVGTEKTSDKDSDFNALATKIKAANPDVVYYGGIYNSGALLLKQLRTAGYKGGFFGGDGLNAADFVAIAGEDAVTDSYSTVVGLPLDKMAEGEQFKAAYEEMFPGKGAEMSPYDSYAFDCANVIIAAALTAAEEMGADQVTSPAGRDSVLAALAASKLTGLTGPIQFDERGDTLNKVITLYTVENGEWTVLQ